MFASIVRNSIRRSAFPVASRASARLHGARSVSVLTSSVMDQQRPTFELTLEQQVRFKSKKAKGKKGKKDKKESDHVQVEVELGEYEFDIQALHDKMKGPIVKFTEDIRHVRSSRVDPSIFDSLMVKVGQDQYDFNSVAQTTVKSPKLVVVTCFDESYVRPTQLAIRNSKMNFNPELNGNSINIKIPAMTQEVREDTVKIVADVRERSKKVINTLRRDAIKKIKNQKDTTHVSEDQLFQDEKKIETMTEAALKKVQELFVQKEKEILAKV